jgi:ATP-dependent RNA helicase DeaD
VLKSLKALGYEEPTPIQRETIPALLQGRDVLGQAATGTGKTAAFALPILEKVKAGDRRPFEAQALVLVPTRELAMQVAEAVQKYGASLGVTSLAVYGGQEIFNQVRPLKRGVDVVIATPGRALDHISRKTLLLKNVKVVVLDEADEMLDMGFEEDLQSILNELPAERQTALFSATLPSRIAKIAEKHLKNPVRVSIAARSLEAGTLPRIRQSAFIVPRKFKEAALMRVLEWETPQSAIIFCRTRTEVEELNHVLMRAGYEPAALHGGLTQEQRDQVLKRFKEGAVRVLVATDVAARGLHVEALSHVVNFDLPTSPEVYVHRIGRTGRAGKEGVALSFLDPREQRLLGNVERQIKGKVALLQVPTREQLAGKRAETVAKQVQAALTDEGVAPFLELAKKAAGKEGTMEQVAAAAMMLLQKKLYPPHESDALEVPATDSRGKPRTSDRGERPSRGDRPDRGERPERSGERRERAPRGDFGPRVGMATLHLSLGTRAGIRPGDLVGAIANEANISSKMISGVEIKEFTSKVDVPEDNVQAIIDALHATRIRGRKVQVSRSGAAPLVPDAPVERKPHRKFEISGPEGESEEAPRRPKASAPTFKRTDQQPDEGRVESVREVVEEAAAPRSSAPRKPRASAPRELRESKDGELSVGEAAPRASAPGKKRFGESRFGGAPAGGKSFGERKPFGADRSGKSFGERKPFGEDRGGKSFGDRKPFGEDRGGTSFESRKPLGERKPYGEDRGGKSFGDRKSFGEKKTFGEDRGERKSFGDKPVAAPSAPRAAKPFGKPRFGASAGQSRPSGGDRVAKRRDFGPPSGPGGGPSRFADKPGRKPHGRMQPRK